MQIWPLDLQRVQEQNLVAHRLQYLVMERHPIDWGAARALRLLCVKCMKPFHVNNKQTLNELFLLKNLDRTTFRNSGAASPIDHINSTFKVTHTKHPKATRRLPKVRLSIYNPPHNNN